MKPYPFDTSEGDFKEEIKELTPEELFYSSKIEQDPITEKYIDALEKQIRLLTRNSLPNTLSQLQRHEKAIKLLNAIEECDIRINKGEFYSKSCFLYRGFIKHYEERIEINKAIKARLQRYYNNHFRL